jgi:hypothetical protein
MKIILKILLCLTFSAIFQPCFAQRYQEEAEKPIAPAQEDSAKHTFRVPEKLFAGGSIGLLLGSTTYIDFSPIAGYEVRPGLLLGAGGSYTYLNYKLRDPYTGAIVDMESFSLYGAKLFTRYTLPFLKSIFLEGDLQAMNVEDLSLPYFMHQRVWIYSPLIGGGLRSELGKKSYYYMLLLYDLNYSYNSQIFPVNGSPLVIRGGILF